jgi:hypothetical protein
MWSLLRNPTLRCGPLPLDGSYNLMWLPLMCDPSPCDCSDECLEMQHALAPFPCCMSLLHGKSYSVAPSNRIESYGVAHTPPLHGIEYHSVPPPQICFFLIAFDGTKAFIVLILVCHPSGDSLE